MGRKTGKILQCKECGSETYKRPCEFNESGNYFCNVICFQKHWGKNPPNYWLNRGRLYPHKKEIIKRYAGGERVTDLAKEFGVNHRTLGEQLDYWKVKKQRTKFKAEPFKDEIIKMYKEGNSILAIGRKYGFEHKVIWRLLLRHGIETRNNNMYSKNIKSDDGHIVRSYTEKEICNFLHHHNILHIYEKPIADTNFKCDFYIPQLNLWIEYWGMNSIDEYYEKTRHKLKIYQELGLNLMSIYPKDDLREKLNLILKWHNEKEAKINEI